MVTQRNNKFWFI